MTSHVKTVDPRKLKFCTRYMEATLIICASSILHLGGPLVLAAWHSLQLVHGSVTHTTAGARQCDTHYSWYTAVWHTLQLVHGSVTLTTAGTRQCDIHYSWYTAVWRTLQLVLTSQLAQHPLSSPRTALTGHGHIKLEHLHTNVEC